MCVCVNERVFVCVYIYSLEYQSLHPSELRPSWFLVSF